MKTMFLPVLRPEYLTAKAETTQAREDLRGAAFALDQMLSRNEKHAADLDGIRQRAPGVAIVTNAQAELTEGRRERLSRPLLAAE